MPLDEEGGHGLWGEAEGERLVQVTGDVAFPQQGQRQQHVLGDRAVREPVANLAQGRAPGHRIGAAAEGRAPGVAAGHDRLEEEALVVRQRLGHRQVRLHRVMVVEAVRDLDDTDLGVFEEAEGPREEGALGHEIGIEYRQELPIRIFERVVDVAGLGPDVISPGDVSYTLLFAIFAQPGAATVVEHIDGEVRPVHAHGADDRLLEHRQGFVVGRDVDIHLGRPRRVLADPREQPRLEDVGLRRAVCSPGEDEEQHRGVQDRQDLDPGEAQGPEVAQPGVAEREGARQPPHQVAEREKGHAGDEQPARPRLAHRDHPGQQADQG